MAMASVSLGNASKFSLLLLVIAAVIGVIVSFPLEETLKKLLIWTKQDLGPWGPLVLIVAYIPLTILAVPASGITLGCGYLFGLPLGVIADSVGSTTGATAAFIVGRTIGRSFVTSKLKDYPKFQAVALAIKKSGFKIIFLLRLVPLLPFNVLNYLLSVTPVPVGEYMLASWLGMLPITFALVYAGTSLKDLSDLSNQDSSSNWGFLAIGFAVSVILMICITKVAKTSLDKALAETSEENITLTHPKSERQRELLRSPRSASTS